jgi:hypothetical protein
MEAVEDNNSNSNSNNNNKMEEMDPGGVTDASVHLVETLWIVMYLDDAFDALLGNMRLKSINC